MMTQGYVQDLLRLLTVPFIRGEDTQCLYSLLTPNHTPH
ncbi:hypothetical protein TNCT_730881, partial [Trichonephila clavata]